MPLEIEEIRQKEDAAHASRRAKVVKEGIADLSWMVQRALGMMSPMFPWDQFEAYARETLERAYQAGADVESSARTQDAMAASMNLLRGVMAGHALGTGDPEQIESTRSFVEGGAS